MRIGVLGSTGSIGRQALEMIEAGKDKYQVSFLAANSNEKLLSEQIARFKPRKIWFGGGSNRVNGEKVYTGDALSDPSFYEGADLVINGIGGIAGLKPTLAALEGPARLATANKESLVAAGKLVTGAARKYNKTIIPLDSEHSAVFQCAAGERPKKIILTASGGAFRDYTKESLKTAKAADALKHPVWKMGNKVTVDSATLFNKGMEIIEARTLFGLEDVSAVIHRESVIHALVGFADGSMKACLYRPDMRLPIQYALTYPEREPCLEFPDLVKPGALTFSEPDYERFPCLKIALETSPGLYPVMSAADEAAAELYLKDKISFYGISDLVSDALGRFSDRKAETAEEVLSIDREVKEYYLK
jgi:1-deoxy-D-xylulose 5-phosphate reductoisomerase